MHWKRAIPCSEHNFFVGGTVYLVAMQISKMCYLKPSSLPCGLAPAVADPGGKFGAITPTEMTTAPISLKPLVKRVVTFCCFSIFPVFFHLL